MPALLAAAAHPESQSGPFTLNKYKDYKSRESRDSVVQEQGKNIAGQLWVKARDGDKLRDVGRGLISKGFHGNSQANCGQQPEPSILTEHQTCAQNLEPSGLSVTSDCNAPTWQE